ncbi:hypothetical protein QM565_08455 [Geitlerinema splendidum]|nr:hypothetical protein [Geitlerinema splendidum]
MSPLFVGLTQQMAIAFLLKQDRTYGYLVNKFIGIDFRQNY